MATTHHVWLLRPCLGCCCPQLVRHRLWGSRCLNVFVEPVLFPFRLGRSCQVIFQAVNSSVASGRRGNIFVRGLCSGVCAPCSHFVGRALNCSDRTRGQLGRRIDHWIVTDVLLGLLLFRGSPKVFAEDKFLLVAHQCHKGGAAAVGAILLLRAVDAKVAADSILERADRTSEQGQTSSKSCRIS